MKEFREKLIARIANSVGKEIALSFSTIGEWNAYRTGCAYKQNQIIDLINQLAEEHNNGWIPCSGCKDCKHKECEHNGKV